MAETTNVSKLIINYLTEAQYQTAKASGLINENELYVTDVQDSTTLDCFEELFTATAGQTLFTLTEGTYVPNQSRLTICVNGAQQPSTAYTETSSSSFTFDSGLSAGDSVIARYVNARIVSNINIEPHKTSHYSGGTDPLTPSDIGAATSTHTHGNITNGGAVGSTPNLPIFTGTNGLLETKTIEDAKTALGASTSFKATGTLTTAGWTGTAAPYTQDLAVMGVLETDRPRVDPVLGTDSAARDLIKAAWQIATTSSNPPYAYNGKITFYAASKPTTNIPVVVSVVRP